MSTSFRDTVESMTLNSLRSCTSNKRGVNASNQGTGQMIQDQTQTKQELDDILVKKAGLGDEVAFRLLMTKYQSLLLRNARQYVHSEADAYDVVQEVMIRAWKGLPSFRGDSKFSTWLFTIVRNTSFNFLSRQKNRRDLSLDAFDEREDGSVDLLESMQDDETPVESLEAQELHGVIQSAIQALPPVLKEALELRELSGLSYVEISERQECPVGTVRSRISRAREDVHQAIAAYRRGEA